MIVTVSHEQCEADLRQAFEALDAAMTLAEQQRARADRAEAALEEAVKAEREACAQVVDQCNRDGPYNAVIAGRLIRARTGEKT